jgi:diguanylate cyclase (GGDEF)-like protein
VVAVMALLVLDVAVFTLFAVPGVRSGPEFLPLVDGWVQGLGYVAAAGLCLLRLRDPEVRDLALWGWLGLALTARAAAFVLFFLVVRTAVPPPYPSVADAFWLLTVLLMTVGLATVARTGLPHLSVGLVLDAVTGALAAAAIALTLTYPTIEARAGSRADAVLVTNLAYPLLDVVMLLMVVGVLAAYEWQPPLPIWALAGGVVGFVVTDLVFLVRVTEGTFHPGTLLSPFTLATNALIAFAAWLPDRSTARQEQLLRSLLLPGLFSTTCLGLLLYASTRPVPLVGVVLAGLGILVAIVRTGLAFRTTRRMAEARLEARTDDLTGVGNRRAFHEALASALRDRSPDRPLALLLIDLDGLRPVHERLGHATSEELLRLVAVRLQDGLGEQDRLSHIGADDFAVVLLDADLDEATAAAERLRAGLRRPFRVAGTELDLGASVGVAVFPRDGLDAEALLRAADLAAYEAKARSTGVAVHRSDPHEANRRRLAAVDRLRRAIEDDELLLHYQPVVEIATGQVVGVEALARWERPGSGLVAPGEFLPLAESGGLMRQLTLDVLAKAVRQAMAWRAAGHRTRLAVNMSVTNLLDVAFPEQLATVLESSGFPGASLDLELTEDLLMADPARARRVVAQLREIGVSLVVDDYGTGYSSLGYLRDLHEISGLKLDRSFVTPLQDDARAAAIVESTIALASSLGLTVVAEGVETSGAREQLTRMGCELAQGFLFSRPVPAEELRFGQIEDPLRSRP